MAITTRDGLVAALAGGLDSPFYKASMTSVAGFHYATFRAAAGFPAASNLATPTTVGNTLSRASAGALALQDAGTDTLYMGAVDLVGATIGSILIADRLVEYGGLSGVTTGAQAVSAVTLPARAGTGVGCELWVDWYTATGATPSATVTCSYTNSDGASGRTATLIGGIVASVPANRCYRMALQAGDKGVQSVQSFSSGTSTATAGNIGLTIRKPIRYHGMPAVNVAQKWGYAETSLTIIPTDACLEFLVLATGTSTGIFQGMISIAQG